MYFFIGSEFSDRVPQNVKLPQAQRRFQRVVKFFRQSHRKLVNRPFRFQKCCQDFIGTHDETLSVAMRVHNPDRSPFAIQGRDAALTPSGLAKSVGDDFPVLYLVVCHMFDAERDKISKLVKERPCKLKSSK
jgi:hypothetical protein